MLEQPIPMTNIPRERIVKEEVEYTVKEAGFWMRFWAFIIDGLVISAITGILIKPVFKVLDWDLDASIWYAPIVILSAVVYFTYFILMTKFFAQTLGKMALGLRVRKDNGEKLDWITVIFRELVGRFISNSFGKIPYLIVIFTPNHKGLHDLIADTVVVHEELYSQKKSVKVMFVEKDTDQSRVEEAVTPQFEAQKVSQNVEPGIVVKDEKQQVNKPSIVEKDTVSPSPSQVEKADATVEENTSIMATSRAKDASAPKEETIELVEGETSVQVEKQGLKKDDSVLGPNDENVEK